MSPPGQGQQPDPFLEVGFGSILVHSEIACNASLLSAPLCGLTVEELGVDAAIELVKVHCVDSSLAMPPTSFREYFPAAYRAYNL